MKVLVTGSEGQLGSKVVELLRSRAHCDVTSAPHAMLDLTRADDVDAAVLSLMPDWIVNCAAYNDVERAETEPDKALLLNDTAVGYLADAADAAGSRLLHVSTDYVFSGEFGMSPRRPYCEEDPPAPLSAYGRSKLAGEVRLRDHPAHSVILRTSWLYGGPGRNFLHTMLRVGEEARRTGKPVRVVNDQLGTPTDAWSLARQVARILEEGCRGLFHASCEGEATWFEFARQIYRLAGLAVALEPIRSADYPGKARRPSYSVLEKRRLRAAGIHEMPAWHEGLALAWRRLGGPTRLAH